MSACFCLLPAKIRKNDRKNGLLPAKKRIVCPQKLVFCPHADTLDSAPACVHVRKNGPLSTKNAENARNARKNAKTHVFSRIFGFLSAFLAFFGAFFFGNFDTRGKKNKMCGQHGYKCGRNIKLRNLFPRGQSEFPRSHL